MSGLIGYHYQLAGYVCGAACYRPETGISIMTFISIWNNRPDTCRFAIVRTVPLLRNIDPSPSTAVFNVGEPAGDWLCWDLLDDKLIETMRRRPEGLGCVPDPIWQAPSKDGLIMKAMALYGR